MSGRVPVLASVLLLALALACGGSGSPSAQPGGGTGGGGGGGGGGGNLTVSGRVVDVRAQPLAGLSVLVAGQTLTTDSSGRFTATGVGAPYDLTVLAPAPSLVAVTYQGLTRTDPTVIAIFSDASPVRTAHVQGALSGGVPVATPGTLTALVFASADALAADAISASPFDLEAQWYGPTTTTGTLHALQWDVANGLPSSYRGQASRPSVTLSSGAVTGGADLTLTPVAVGSIGGTCTAPPGLGVASRDLLVGWSDGALVSIASDVTTASAFSYPVPSASNLVAGLVCTASDSTSRPTRTSAALQLPVAPGTTTLALAPPAPATTTAPADGATGVTLQTTLQWTAVPSAAYLLYARGAAGQPSFWIVTTSTSAKLPDLSSRGFGLPRGATYDLSLLAFAPVATLDALAGPTPRLAPSGPAQVETVSASRFVTQ